MISAELSMKKSFITSGPDSDMLSNKSLLARIYFLTNFVLVAFTYTLQVQARSGASTENYDRVPVIYYRDQGRNYLQ